MDSCNGLSIQELGVWIAGGLFTFVTLVALWKLVDVVKFWGSSTVRVEKREAPVDLRGLGFKVVLLLLATTAIVVLALAVRAV